MSARPVRLVAERPWHILCALRSPELPIARIWGCVAPGNRSILQDHASTAGFLLALSRARVSAGVLLYGIGALLLGVANAAAAPVIFDFDLSVEITESPFNIRQRLDLRAAADGISGAQFAQATDIDLMMTHAANSARAEQFKWAVAIAALRELLETREGTFAQSGGAGLGSVAVDARFDAAVGKATDGRFLDAVLGDLSATTGRSAETTLQLRHAMLDSFDAVAGVRSTMSSVQGIVAQYSPLNISVADTDRRPASAKLGRSDGELFNQIFRIASSVVEAIQDYYWIALLLAALVFLLKLAGRR